MENAINAFGSALNNMPELDSKTFLAVFGLVGLVHLAEKAIGMIPEIMENGYELKLSNQLLNLELGKAES